jgi:hypothetical protein
MSENPMARAVAIELSTRLEAAADATEAEMHRAAEPPAAAPASQRTARPRSRAAALHLHPVAQDQWEIHGPGCAVLVAGLDDMETAERMMASLGSGSPEPETALSVAMLAARPLRKPSRPRGRPRKTAPRSPDADAPPMAAAPGEG